MALVVSALAALAALYAAHRLGVVSGVAVSRDAGGVHPALRVGAAALVLFGVTGFGVVRWLLPSSLARHEPLWVLPVGACVVALGMSVFGYAGVPYGVALGLVLGLGAALSVVAVLRRGLGVRRWSVGACAWPVYVAGLAAFVAVIPLLRSDFATVIGYGADAHLAVGTAQFLQHHYPTSFHLGSPINEVPLVWRSKVPIYYAFAAVSSLSGLAPYAVISSLEAVMLALTLLGVWLLCRELLGAGVAASTAAVGLVALDRMVLHTITHPYYNQTWGMFAVPFLLVLSWSVLEPGSGERRGAWALLALLAAVCAFAYPLALPIPALAFVVMAWARPGRERWSARGFARRVWRGPRSLLWIVPLVAVLAVPLRGVVEKLTSGYDAVFNPFLTLNGWGGDLGAYFPEYQFVGVRSAAWLWVVLPVGLVGLVLALRERPRAVRWAMWAVVGFGVAAAAYFRLRTYGYYFHFKVLAFVAPLAVAAAVVGLTRLRVVGWVLVAGWLALAWSGARAEVNSITNELPVGMIHLQPLDRSLPPGSIRLDMDPSLQLWVAEMLPRHRLCSQTPVLGTSYPHVTVSRRADYVLVDYEMRPPFDRAGPAMWRDEEFRLYRERADVPGVDACSQRRVQTVTSISGE